MNNKILIGSLGLVFAFCIAVTGFIDKEQEAFLDTEAQVKYMSTSISSKVGADSGFLNQYNINELKENYVLPKIIGKRKIINVPVINQYPELPVGCEITSATVILNYLGFNVDKVYMQENFMEDSYDFYYVNDEKRFGPDPSKVFVGNPKGTGFGCFSTVIVDTLNKFFSAYNDKSYAINLTDADQATLETLIDNGIPVLVWASIEMKPFKYTENNDWILETTGEPFNWPSNSHALVLAGYDDNNYIFSDCNNYTELKSFRKSDFLKRWEQFGKQGLIVKVNK